MGRRLGQGLGLLLLLVGGALIVLTGLNVRTFKTEQTIVVWLPTRALVYTPPSTPARSSPEPTLTPQPTPTVVRDPLVPITATLPATTSIVTTPSAISVRARPEDRWRFGVGVPYPPLTAALADRLGIGWYLSWRVEVQPPYLPGVEFWQMIRLSESGYRPRAEVIVAAARANPGATWLIGNEPDVIWQDNVTSRTYARYYHDLYRLLKEADPTCQVAIGGVSQPTPLRLAYLDQVLAAYEGLFQEPMPVDVWNVHDFVLREERDSWGVGIPPGLAADRGQLFEIEDNDNLPVFQRQIVDFRRWMRERGQQNKPLVVSEYGIPMPADYGFDAQRVADFMTGTFDYMLAAADPGLGYPADDYHLVQRWAWYSLADDTYPTGNLVDVADGSLTGLGQVYAGYTGASSR